MFVYKVYLLQINAVPYYANKTGNEYCDPLTLKPIKWVFGHMTLHQSDSGNTYIKGVMLSFGHQL